MQSWKAGGWGMVTFPRYRAPTMSGEARAEAERASWLLPLGLAVACLVGAVALLLGSRSGSSDDWVVSDHGFTYFDGTEGSLLDYRGTPLVVNFWASTCVPCIDEMPDFEEVHREVGDRVAFLGVDVQERVEEGMEMVDKTKVTYDLASDFDGSLMAETAPVVLLPTTLFIDEDSRLVGSHTGALDKDELASLIDRYFEREAE